LQTAEIVAECRKDGRSVAALHVAEEGVRTNEAVARIFRNRTEHPTEHTIVNRTRPQLDESFRDQVIDLRWAGQNGSAVKIVTVVSERKPMMRNSPISVGSLASATCSTVRGARLE